VQAHVVEEVQARGAAQPRRHTAPRARALSCALNAARPLSLPPPPPRAQAAMKDFQDKNTYTAPTTAGGATAA
jgi:hypothetical protein